MNRTAQTTTVLKAPVNFTASNEPGGVFSNFDPSLNTLVLKAHEVDLIDARQLTTPTALDSEGFELHTLAFPGGDLLDPEWVANVYGPRVGAFLQQLTGAAHVAPFRGHRVLIRDTGKLAPGRATAADFAHIDQTESSGVH